MNRRQEVAAWGVGVLLAGISAYHGAENGEWLFEYFIPVIVTGPLLVHSLRDRAAPSSSDQVLKRALGLVLIAALFAHVKHRADASSFDPLREHEGAVTDSRLTELEHKVDALETRFLFER